MARTENRYLVLQWLRGWWSIKVSRLWLVTASCSHFNSRISDLQDLKYLYSSSKCIDFCIYCLLTKMNWPDHSVNIYFGFLLNTWTSCYHAKRFNDFYNSNALAILIRKHTGGGGESVLPQAPFVSHKTRGLNPAADGDSLSKHGGDLGLCTPFSDATESLELCNEPNWVKGPDLLWVVWFKMVMRLAFYFKDRHLWKPLRGQDLVCGL